MPDPACDKNEFNGLSGHNPDFYFVAGNTACDDPRYVQSRSRWEKFTRTLEIAPAPLHVDIELTNMCDLDCIMCERRFMKRPIGLMAMDTFSEIIRQCNEICVDSVKLNLWGESLLHPNLIEMVRYAKTNSKLILQFNTNGNRLTPEISRGLIQAGLDRLTISLDGVTKQTYEKIRRKGNLDTVLSNINSLLSEKKAGSFKLPRVTLQIIRMEDNSQEVDEFVGYWQEKVDCVNVTNIGVTSNVQEINSLSVTGNATARCQPCAQLWQRLSVYFNGTVTVCCSDFNGFLAVGDLKDGLLNLWHGKKLSEFRRKHKDLDFEGMVCAKCTQ